jgi:hypothetical protein
VLTPVAESSESLAERCFCSPCESLLNHERYWHVNFGLKHDAGTSSRTGMWTRSWLRIKHQIRCIKSITTGTSQSKTWSNTVFSQMSLAEDAGYLTERVGAEPVHNLLWGEKNMRIFREFQDRTTDSPHRFPRDSTRTDSWVNRTW